MKKAGTIALTTVVVAAVWVAAHAQQGPRVRTLTEQEVADILVGSSIQGTRNGNSAGVIRNEADGAMIAALQSAVELGVPVVDACLAGRAKPELNLQVSFANGISGTPAALVTRWGDVIILDKTVDDYRLEDLARAVAVSSGGGSSIARNPMTGRDVKRGTVKGALTEAMLFGRTVREAKARGKDPIAALIAVANQSRPTFKMFHGTVTRSDQKGERGFNWVDAEIAGTKQFAGHAYKVYVKNENI